MAKKQLIPIVKGTFLIWRERNSTLRTDMIALKISCQRRYVMKTMISREIDIIGQKIVDKDQTMVEMGEDTATSEAKVEPSSGGANVKSEEDVSPKPTNNQPTPNLLTKDDPNNDLQSQLCNEIIVRFQQWRDKPTSDQDSPWALKLNGEIWKKVRNVDEVVEELISKSELTVFALTLNEATCLHYVIARTIGGVWTPSQPKILDQKTDHFKSRIQKTRENLGRLLAYKNKSSDNFNKIKHLLKKNYSRF